MELRITTSFVEAFKKYKKDNALLEEAPVGSWMAQWYAIADSEYSLFKRMYPRCNVSKKLFREALSYHMWGRQILMFLHAADTTGLKEHYFFEAQKRIENIQQGKRN